MVILGVTRQSWRHFVKRQLREYRHPVERLLAMHGDVVTERLEGVARKGVVDAFGFLQADDVGRAFLQPGDGAVDPLLD